MFSSEAEIIEIAYDLQAGSYVEIADANSEWLNNFSVEASNILNHHLTNIQTFLDAGCGELTTTTNILNSLNNFPKTVFAFDLSLSRLLHGRRYWEQHSLEAGTLSLFSGEFQSIPLPSNCIEATTTIHSLEPNKANLRRCLKELFRVTSKRLFLFEPCYEKATKKAQQRMETHGYIKNLELETKSLGGKILEIREIQNPSNKLNPTYCFVVEPSHQTNETNVTQPFFSLPGTDYNLTSDNDFLLSNDAGIIFPKLMGIPMLRPKNGIIANTLCNSDEFKSA